MGMIGVESAVRFTTDIIEPADGDHPEFLFASKGDIGIVVSVLSEDSYIIRCGVRFVRRFRVNRNEIEVVS